jgi:hypothetical protein
MSDTPPTIRSTPAATRLRRMSTVVACWVLAFGRGSKLKRNPTAVPQALDTPPASNGCTVSCARGASLVGIASGISHASDGY